jgi:hypothetical protein
MVLDRETNDLEDKVFKKWLEKAKKGAKHEQTNEVKENETE